MRLGELPFRISTKLTEHAESRQIDLRNIRSWMTDSQNPPASSAFGKHATGFTITSFPGDQIGSFYVGLGPEAAAAECFSAVRSAITAAENPTN